ncbi:hypothetical protein DFJ73DRAFT_635749, partial [Zopfochytrium polystomum]
PEEDGLYVGDPPKVNPKNLRKVEKRLRASEPNHGESWFGPSQHLALLPNPLRYRSYRPNAPPPVPIPAALVGQAQNSGSDLAFPSRSSLATVATRFREIPGGAGARDGLGDGRGEYTLVFCLAGLDVEEHPLLCEEIKLAREVERWISALRARRSADVTGFLTKKLTALKASYDEYLKRSSRLLAALTAAAANRDGRPKNSDGSPVSGYFQQTAAAREAAWREKARDEHEEKRLSYMNEIRATRLQRDAESQATLLLEFKILEAWNKIKQLRRTSGCTSSPLKVLVRPFPSHLSAEEERLEFDRDLRDELLELEELHEFEMEIEHRRYKETVAKWKEAREAQRNEANSAAVAAKGADGGAGRKQTTSSPSKKAEDEDGKGSLWLKSASEEALRVEAEVEKEAIKRAKREEELPALLSERTELRRKRLLRARSPRRKSAGEARRLESSRKRIGAPILAISYSFSEPVTEMIKCSKDEHRRRLQVDATSVFLRIYYNDKEVTRTVPRPIDPERFSVSVKGVQNLGEDYSINVDEATRGRAEEATVFAVKVTEIPESIRINVYETGVLGEDFLGEVFVALPEPTETTRNQDRPFSNISFVGRPFRKSPSVLGTTTTDEALTGSWVSGHLKINVAWGVDEEGRSLGPPLRQLSGSAPGVLNLRKLMEWVADIQIDAKDPRNAELLRIKELMRMGTDGGNGVQFYERWSQRKFFRVNMPKKLLEVAVGVGVSTDISDTSKRIELLKKRARNEVVVHGPVPLVDSEIHAALYDKVADPVKDDAVAMSIWSPASRSAMPNPKTDTSLVATSFLKRVRMHQLIQSARQHRPPRVEDFVREERLAEAQPQQNILFTLFQTRRPLKPNRTSRLSRVTSQPDDGCNIVVQVQKGFNIPVRSKDSKIEDVLTPRNLTGEVEPSVRCYVEVSFQRRKVRTSITDGPNPTWNESLTLPLRPPGDDFRPENLLDSTVGMEQIFFNVFDEYLVDLVEDERERDIEIHQRRERNWLGGFSIPFTSLYEQTRIEGSFHVMIPPVLLGYEKNPTAGPLENSILIGIDPAGESLLNLFITLEPPLVQPAPLHLKFISDETERFLRYASKWTHALTARHPHRPVLATTLDLTGHTTFICRYIRPQQPPQHLTTPRQLQRYVSSIPFLADRTAFAADVSLWATSEQVLELGAGDSTEHAILLCNYLKAARPAGVDAYVVLGWGIPEGRTAYVLVRNKVGYGEVQVTLMNAVTGESYRARDPHLPLKVVGCVFNEENIWANVQRHDDPARVSWNIHDAACWRPFFSSRFPRFDYTSVQCDLLTYRDVSARRCKELEGSIEKTLVAKIESWRGHRLTRWNRLASKCLKPLVSRLEADHLSLHTIPTAATAAAAAAATSSLKGTYRLCGFPLHATYTDVDAVVEMVHATDVHANADPSVEFALAVWCGGYPGGFVSVWVYVASLTRGKGGL